MKATAILNEGFRSIIDNERNHVLAADLPESKNGTNTGPTALELAVMALAGCVSTIFAVIAKNSKLSFSNISAQVNTNDPQPGKTIETAEIKVSVVSKEPQDKIQRILDKTMKACPVGMIFEKAGIEIKTSLTVNPL